MAAEDFEEDEEYKWGPSQSDYYGADTIETEQDAQMEEAESNRLQQKRLEAMTEADFGFDEDESTSDIENGAEGNSNHKVIRVEKIPQLSITTDTAPEQQLQMLYDRYPEFQHLRKEFLDLEPVHKEVSAACGRIQANLQSSGISEEALSAGDAVHLLKYQALSVYIASIAMYFALLSSPRTIDRDTGIPIAPHELRKHPVMDYLLRGREAWQKVEDIEIPEPADEQSSSEAILNDGTDDVSSEEMVTQQPVERKRKRKISKAQQAAQAAAAAVLEKRQQQIHQTHLDLAGLSALLERPSVPKTAPNPIQARTFDPEDSDFGEETSLTVEEAAEKARKKKSLRFYTSQIAQKANIRGSKSRAAGGDDDLPYRERLKDRQARLNEQAEKRGKMAKKAQEELGGDSDEDDRRIAKDVRSAEGSGDDDEDYYDMIAARVAKKKSDNKVRAEAYAEAKAQNARVVEVEDVGPDGKRKISYAIEKNKGLTPFRKKDVRNPRVKKRKKFEEKKKKLGSVRQVWKGGEGKGGYGGELTGIKTGLVRSVKL